MPTRESRTSVKSMSQRPASFVLQTLLQFKRSAECVYASMSNTFSTWVGREEEEGVERKNKYSTPDREHNPCRMRGCACTFAQVTLNCHFKFQHFGCEGQGQG